MTTNSSPPGQGSPPDQGSPADPAAVLADRLFHDMIGALARRNAEQAGVSGRVTFAVTDASGPGISGRFDLVTIFEALHDMSRPVDALRTARRLLTPSGSVVIADELTADVFTAPASDLERYLYGWSVVSCLPSAMGTQARPPPER